MKNLLIKNLFLVSLLLNNSNILQANTVDECHEFKHFLKQSFLKTDKKHDLSKAQLPDLMNEENDECHEFKGFFEQSKQTFFNTYGTKHDLSKLKLLDFANEEKNIINNKNFYNSEIKNTEPVVVEYTCNKYGKKKTITFIATSHDDPKITDCLNNQTQNFDLVIGEYPALRTLEYRYHEFITAQQECSPFLDASRMQPLMNPNADVLQIEAFCRKNNKKLINGEQDLQKYLTDCSKIGWSPDQVAAIPKYLQNPYAEIDIITFPREITLINMQEINPQVRKHSYQTMKCYFRMLTFMRDCHVLKTLFDSLENHDNILIVYGSFHWITQQDVLAQHLGQPKITPYKELMKSENHE